MKKLLVILAIFFGFTASASHLMGGMIAIANQGPDSTAIGMYLVSDVFPNMPQSVSIEKWKADSQGWYQLEGYVTLDKITTNSHQGFNTSNYVSDYMDLDSGQYRFIYKNCCWPVLNNSSNSMASEFVISTDYWHVPSSYTSSWNNITPYMEQPMWINMQKDSINVMKPVWGVFNCHFTNPEADSVNFYQTELYSSYSNGVFVPQVQSPSNMYASNDSITFVSSTLGSVGNGFQIDRYRAGYLMSTQRIQWTFIVKNSTIGIEELQFEKEIIGVWDFQGQRVEIQQPNNPYVIRYNDGSYDKIFIVN